MKLLKRIFLKTFPVLTGYLVLGMGFGILMVKNGYGMGWILAMSLFIYAGSMQYLGISLLTGGAGFIQTALTTLMVNARHLFYGISMVDAYKNAGKVKAYLAFSLTDETYSLVCQDELAREEHPFRSYFLISLFNHVYWVLGSVLGGVLGQFIPFDTTGIDFSMTALFITVFVEQWLGTKEHFPAISGLVSAMVCLLFFGQENFLIPTMIVITVSLLLWKKKRRDDT